MSLACSPAVFVRAVPVTRAGVLAHDICHRGGNGTVAAVFDRSLYLRKRDAFICIGEAAIGNGPLTLIIPARVAQLGMRKSQPALLSKECIAVGDVVFDLRGCETWRSPAWPLPSPAVFRAGCEVLACRAATDSPPDSLARAVFTADDTPLARLARPRVATFATWLCRVGKGRAAAVPTREHHQRRVGTRAVRALPTLRSLVGLGSGLTPSGDDFLIGALAMLDALGQTNMHAQLGEAVAAALERTSPLSASFLRAAAAGHVGENLHVMIAALIAGDVDAAVAAAARIGHTSGWDALAGAVVTARSR